MKRVLALLALAAALYGAPAAAWGDYAHRLTGRIADNELTPAARAELARLLAQNAKLGTPDCPIRSLADAASWPDCVRGLGDRYAYAAKWHYQNIPRCGRFDIASGCAGGNCLTVQLDRQIAVLADRRQPPRKRLEALGFVAHLVGDLHQPLHVSDSGDRGGNEVKVRYGYDPDTLLNLHRIWDRELAERALTAPPVVTPQSISAAQRARWRQGSIADWVQASWALSSTMVYGKLPALAAACSTPPARPVVVDDGYYRANEALIRAQVERAGVRLGVVLNQALAQKPE
jgi:hypothetical protein